MQEANIIKEKGNLAFSSKRYEEAEELYDESLSCLQNSVKEPSSSIKPSSTSLLINLTCTILTNKSACLLALKKYDDCIRVATQALALEKGKIKALYRRGQAYEELGEYEESLRDYRLALHFEPSNQDVLKAARRVREAMQTRSQAQGDGSPLSQMLKVLKTEGSSTGARQEALKGLIGLSADDAATAMNIYKRCGLSLVTPYLSQEKTQHNAEAERLLALRLFSACCHHPSFVIEAFFTTKESSKSGDPSIIQGLQQLVMKEEDESIAHTVIIIFLRVAKGLYKFEKARSEEDIDHRITLEALACWLLALNHPKEAVRESALDALLWWRSSESHIGETATARGIDYVVEGDGLYQLLGAVERKDVKERLKASLVLGRFLEIRPEADVESIKTKASTWFDKIGEETKLSSVRAEKILLLVMSLFYANTDLGCWALETKGYDQLLHLIRPSNEADAQIIAAELLNLAASTETGRAVIGPHVVGNGLQRLMQSTVVGARVAAASAFTKLGLAAKALSSTSSDLSQLLNIAVDALQAKQAKPPYASVTTHSSSVSIQRAIEILSCLVTKTSFKNEMTYGSGRCKACLPLLIFQVNDKLKRGEHAYGMAFILASITLSNDQLRKEALAEKDISPEQYEQIQAMQKMQNGGENGEAKESDADPPDNVHGRIKELVKLGGIRTLCILAVDATSFTQEQVATAFVQISAVPEHRGLMIQQGGYNACLDLSTEGAAGQKARTQAIHALAKCLVTTNPQLLSDRQRMDSIVGLLWLCKYGKSTNLQQFEALMALTNLASCNEAIKDSIASHHKGIPIIQSLQYSDHSLVRRAATETICNLASHPEALRNLRNKDKLKIWFALADDYEADLPTARAAAGALAIAAADEGVAKVMADKETGGIEVWCSLLQCGMVDLVHRAAAGICNMASSEEARGLLVEHGGLKQALDSLLQKGEGSQAKEILSIAQSAFQMLKTETK